MSKLFVVAPRLIVLSNRAIMLNGIDGANQTDTPQGSNGEAGYPGVSGGGFLGVISEFSNLGNLVINVNGGNGGPGQAGGRGYDSKYQLKILRLPNKKVEIGPDYRNIFSGFQYKYQKEIKQSYLMAVVYIRKEYTIEVIDAGEVGGNGFMPGPGGHGGWSGVVNIIFLNETSHVNILNFIGQKGTNGTYGPGGRGSNGMKYQVIEKFELPFPWIPLTSFSINSSTQFYNPPGQNNFHINPHALINIPPSIVMSDTEKLSFVMKYKLYLLQRMTEVVDSTNLVNFYRQLSQSPDIDRIYDVIAFVTDLKNLESITHKSHNYISVYDTLMKKIQSFCLKGVSSVDQKILLYVYTTALAQLARFKSSSENSLIIQIGNYFQIIKNNCQSMQSLASEVIKYESTIAYNELIENKINEIKILLDQTVIPKVSTIQEKSDEYLERTINKTICLKNDYKKHEDELLQNKAEIEKNLIFSQTTGVFKVLGSVLSLFGDVGQKVYEIISGTSSVVDLLISPVKIDSNSKDIPANAFTAVSNTESIISDYFKSKIRAFGDVLQTMEIEIGKYPNVLQDLASNIATMKSQNIEDIDELNSFQVELSNLILNKQRELETESTVEHTSKSNIIGVIISLQNMFKIVKVAGAAVNLYYKYKHDDAVLNEIYKALNSTHESIGTLTDYELYVSRTLRPLLKRMNTNMNDYNKNLKSKSHEILDVSRWKIQQHVRVMKQLLIKTTVGFSERDDIIGLVDELHETMNIMVNLYDRIQNYYDEKRLVDYLQVINSKVMTDIDVKNDKLKKELLDLDYSIKTNLIRQQYQLALNAFKQLVFPFAHDFLSEYIIPDNFESSRGNYLRNWTINKIDSLSTKLSEQRVKINAKVDTFIFETNFDHEPFYTWNNIRHSKIFSDLFDGKEILLKANVFDANVKNAVKFKSIGLNFIHIYNDSLEVLNNYNIRLKHLGNSYYRCNDKYYVLTTESQTFEYSYRRDKNQVPMNKNAVYSKIENGHYMLSPYTMWSVRLIDNDEKGYSFLQKLRSQVTVQLIGKGQYVSSDSDVCKKNLNDYYEVVPKRYYKLPDM